MTSPPPHHDNRPRCLLPLARCPSGIFKKVGPACRHHTASVLRPACTANWLLSPGRSTRRFCRDSVRCSFCTECTALPSALSDAFESAPDFQDPLLFDILASGSCDVTATSWQNDGHHNGQITRQWHVCDPVVTNKVSTPAQVFLRHLQLWGPSLCFPHLRASHLFNGLDCGPTADVGHHHRRMV